MRQTTGFCTGLLLLLAAAFAVRAQDADSPPMLLPRQASLQLLEEGRRALFRLQTDEAERLFYRLSRHPQGRAAAYHHLATTALISALITEEEQHFDTFFQRSDSLSRILDGLPPSAWRTYLEAERQLERVVALSRTDHMIRAALAARAAYGGYQNALRQRAEFYEPYQGLGLLHIAIGSLPGKYRRLMDFIGYAGDVDKGLRELRAAARYSRYKDATARILLALVLADLEEAPGKALRLMGALHREHPKSPLIGYFHGVMLLENRRAEEAEKVLRTASERLQGYSGGVYLDNVDFYLAEALFRQNEYTAAERYYRRYLARHEGDALKAEAGLRLGLLLEMQSDPEAALFYERAVQLSDRGDGAVPREARRRINEPMGERERRLLRARNHFKAGKYEQAVSILQRIRGASTDAVPLQVEATYWLGRLFHVQGQDGRALELYRQVMAGDAGGRGRWAPWSQYYVARLHEERGRNAQARRAYRAALDYEKPFDGHQSLTRRTRRALDRLAAAEAE